MNNFDKDFINDIQRITKKLKLIIQNDVKNGNYTRQELQRVLAVFPEFSKFVKKVI